MLYPWRDETEYAEEEATKDQILSFALDPDTGFARHFLASLLDIDSYRIGDDEACVDLLDSLLAHDNLLKKDGLSNKMYYHKQIEEKFNRSYSHHDEFYEWRHAQ